MELKPQRVEIGKWGVVLGSWGVDIDDPGENWYEVACDVFP